jgi:hypothetical protein
MPLSLATEEMDLLLSLAQPIDQRQRDQFLHEVAAELEGSDRPARSARAQCTALRAQFNGDFSTRRRSARRRKDRAARPAEPRSSSPRQSMVPARN